jgi:hypothetical protein
MSEARFGFTATLLQNGEVLVAGGSGDTAFTSVTAELYNPSTGEWTSTGSMTQPRSYHSATRLPTGEVLVAGGLTGSATGATAELYDPSTGTWQVTRSLSIARANGAAALLQNGQVLLAGGYNYTNGSEPSWPAPNFITPPQGRGASLPAWQRASSALLLCCLRTTMC